MKYELAKVLYDKDLFFEEAQFTAIYEAKSMDDSKRFVTTGRFILISMSEVDNEIAFKVKDKNTEKPRIISSNDIIAIDGMSPERYGLVFDLKEDGTPAPIKKKRGRKTADNPW